MSTWPTSGKDVDIGHNLSLENQRQGAKCFCSFKLHKESQNINNRNEKNGLITPIIRNTNKTETFSSIFMIIKVKC